MKLKLDWTQYENAGLGDAYADIPKTGGNFGKAVAVCINSMHCLRPVEKGLMCPSFRVTGDVLYSPGGRSRLLKKMLNNDITSEEQLLLDRSMAACVACKGCKRECDTNLDMAAIRSEYLAFRSKSTPLRSRIFAEMPNILRLPLVIPALGFIQAHLPKLDRFLKRMLSLDENRKLPMPNAGYRKNSEELKSLKRFAGTEVVVVVDCLTRKFKPETAIAAEKVLRNLGYIVNVVGDNSQAHLCCGRTWYSQGLIEKAASKAKNFLNALEPYASNNLPIIALEPSCLSMLRDEYLTLELGDTAKAVASRAFLFEEFVAKEISSGRLTLKYKTPESPKPVLVHGHCHQKAMGAMKSMRKVLKSIPDLDFEFIDSSCCGGAGAFAFEKEHAEQSKEMVSQAIIPALQQQPDHVLVTNGFSCREQIENHSQRRGIHLAELMNRYL